MHNLITDGTGVKLDMEVDNLPYTTFRGEGAQLDAAIAHLLDKMAKDSMKIQALPPFPAKSKLLGYTVLQMPPLGTPSGM